MSPAAVALRPIVETDLPALEHLLFAPEAVGPFQWYGWSNPAGWRARWAQDGLLTDELSQLAVIAGGELCGAVEWHRVASGPSSYHWNLGIQLGPEARGRGIGTRAQLLLVDYLFAHTPVVRLEADTEADNHAEQRALEKCGFGREGVLRSATFRDGAWRDMVRYGLLRADPRPGPGTGPGTGAEGGALASA
ncbi:GNAT family protein [Kitasatospora sp. NPDC097643]|uniref:GNAT family N-acetyltransferase n=1 Tax=Kitasatospora sp. NPDC097643 TaxID=3157230 RepID=UPI00332D7F19